MEQKGVHPSRYGLDHHGIINATPWWNLTTAALYEQAVLRQEGVGLLQRQAHVRFCSRMMRSTMLRNSSAE